MREELYADEVISCHHPTRQLLHTHLEIKCWSWAPFAAETWNASMGRRDHPSRAPAFHLCLSKQKSSRLTVVSLCTPSFHGSHFKSLSGYIFYLGKLRHSTLSILFIFHWESGRVRNRSWLSKAVLALWPWTTLTYHRDPVRLMVVLFSELHHRLPCWKELMVLHLSFSTFWCHWLHFTAMTFYIPLSSVRQEITK